jgi:hypothetical protein
MSASTYYNSDAGIRVCVPAYERIKQLYAFGYTNSQILETIESEFSDIDYNSYSMESLKSLIKENKKEFDAARMEMGLQCREEIQRQIALLFNKTEKTECLMVEIYVNKMHKALEELRDLELDELDDDGNFKNTSRVFVLIELVDKFQSKISKVVGTDALREIEIYRMKMEAKVNAEQNKGSLLPPTAGKTVDVTTNFI